MFEKSSISEGKLNFYTLNMVYSESMYCVWEIISVGIHLFDYSHEYHIYVGNIIFDVLETNYTLTYTLDFIQ